MLSLRAEVPFARICKKLRLASQPPSHTTGGVKHLLPIGSLGIPPILLGFGTQ